MARGGTGHTRPNGRIWQLAAGQRRRCWDTEATAVCVCGQRFAHSWTQAGKAGAGSDGHMPMHALSEPPGQPDGEGEGGDGDGGEGEGEGGGEGPPEKVDP